MTQTRGLSIVNQALYLLLSLLNYRLQEIAAILPHNQPPPPPPSGSRIFPESAAGQTALPLLFPAGFFMWQEEPIGKNISNDPGYTRIENRLVFVRRCFRGYVPRVIICVWMR